MIERFSRPSSRVERALGVALLSHEGAVRKGTAIPYIEHPVSVAVLLEQYGYGEDLVVAGLLHDTVEDTKYENVGVQQRLSRFAGEAACPAPPSRSSSASRFSGSSSTSSAAGCSTWSWP